MKIQPFELENWLNPAADSEKNKYYLGGSCVHPMTVEELFDVITVATSTLEWIGWSVYGRCQKQRGVNEKNRKRGYWE